MATATSPSSVSEAARGGLSTASLRDAAIKTLYLFGSLKLTVALFAFSLLLVFAGTLAQHHMNMQQVKEQYFTCWVATLALNDILPPAFFPTEGRLAYDGPYPGAIFIPGGALVGLLLMINLLAAKATRFRIQAAGTALAAGIGVMAVGLVAMTMIILAGHNTEGLQGEPPMSYARLWAICLGTLAAGWVGVVGLAISSPSRSAKIAWGAVALGIGAYLVFSLATGHRIGDPGLRIVWQLAKGLGAGAILLVGCLMLFKKQAGNILLHFGVALLMLGQFIFGDRQTEQRLTLMEGQSANQFVNLDQVELVFIRQDDDQREVFAVPASRLQRAARSNEVIRDEQLPLDIRVLAYYPNSRLQSADEVEIKADRGLGQRVGAVEAPGVGGTSSEVNVASAYIELLDRSSAESLGKHLVSQYFSEQKSLFRGGTRDDEFDDVEEPDLQVGLQFARTPKPFWVHLNEVRRVDYSGTSTPRDYRSFVRIVDPETGEDRREQIWMNNPLRFRGQTYYQSNYEQLADGREVTTLQVVQNSGWLIPYVACSITALGMCVHFGGTLRRFVRRRQQERRLAADASGPAGGAYGPPPSGDSMAGPSARPRSVYLTVGGAVLFALLALVPWPAVMDRMRPGNRDQRFDMYAAGQIPVQFGGRVMPLAAYASQSLKAMSNRSSLKIGEETPGAITDRVDGKKLSPTQWLLEVAIDDERLEDLPMFRVDASEVRDELELPRRPSKLVSLRELKQHSERFSRLTQAARDKESIDQSFKEKKLIELDQRTRAFTMTAAAFRPRVIEEIPEEMIPEGVTAEQVRQFQQQQRQELENFFEFVEGSTSPGLIPPPVDELELAVDMPKWSTYAYALHRLAGDEAESAAEPGVGVSTFRRLVAAYRDKDPQRFNEAVDAHLATVGEIGTSRVATSGYTPGRVALERWKEFNNPTYVAMFLYLLAFGLGCVYLMGNNLTNLRSGVWGILIVALAIHTLVLLTRIVITGRAPVINLYSSAVFIGWAGVIFGVVQERIFRLGEGNLLAAGSGVLALLVAYGLDKGDTMPVLQAVLDTQFWLGTHVITVTLGYTATMVAGLMGIRWLAARWLGADGDQLRQIYRSMYGATCFGILFSFVGTVLGGLWADDSWGRFWGWDPKENGALLIVIWNALMLHARWDGMVGPRGFSILAIGGNIVTAWSYFGTNELGIGLHSYGFTEGVLMWLGIFVLSQLACIVAGLILTKPAGADGR